MIDPQLVRDNEEEPEDDGRGLQKEQTAYS